MTTPTLLGKIETNPWLQLSNNRFSYNICTASSVAERHKHFITELESSEGKLPPAHVAFPILEELRLQHQCYLPKGGFSSWKNGLVTELVPGRAPKMCEKLFTKQTLTTEEEDWIHESNRLWRASKNMSDLVTKTKDCAWVKSTFKDNFFVSDSERDFPIAYALNLDKHPHQILRFLKVIYRPHNLYCLHFDLKSSHTFKRIIFNLASCLDNVIVPRKIEDVYRGWYTLVEAHASCFSDLMLARDQYPWKYAITLCGKELPLRTNAEIVSLLEPLNGMSSIKIIGPYKRDKNKYRFKWTLNKVTGWLSMRDVPMSSIPYHMKAHKSWAYIALSHAFVEYYLCSEVGITLRNYMKDVYIPEESIYPTLFMKPGVPGGYRAEDKNKLFFVMSCIWLSKTNFKDFSLTLYDVWWDRKRYCSGNIVHDICMVNNHDLFLLPYKPGIGSNTTTGCFSGSVGSYDGPDRGPIVHNKYSMDEDMVVMDCMEQELIRRNRLEYRQKCEQL